MRGQCIWFWVCLNFDCLDQLLSNFVVVIFVSLKLLWLICVINLLTLKVICNVMSKFKSWQKLVRGVAGTATTSILPTAMQTLLNKEKASVLRQTYLIRLLLLLLRDWRGLLGVLIVLLLVQLIWLFRPRWAIFWICIGWRLKLTFSFVTLGRQCLWSRLQFGLTLHYSFTRCVHLLVLWSN